MPNRLIKESICTSDNLNELSLPEEVFFYRLIVNCDDYGIADARPSILRAKCFPLKVDTIQESDVENWLISLASKNLIFMYEIDGKRYLKMTSWEKHQQIRAKKSKFPLPNSNGVNLISNNINGNQMIANVPVIQSNPIQSESNPNTTTTTIQEEQVGSCGNDFNIFLYMQKHGFVSISSSLMEKINADIEMYSLEEVKTAIDIADDNGKHAYSYIKGILEHRRSGVNDKLENQKKVEQAMKEFLEDSSI